MRREFKARENLETSNRKLIELDRLKNEFFANVSHELRTPLTLIIGSFQRFLKEHIPTRLRPLADVGLRNSGQLLMLINDLLDLAKSDSGRLTPAKQCIDMAALVRQVAANFASSTSNH